MALSFPLSRPAFFNGLRVTSVRFYLPETLEMNRTEGGAVILADRGARLWHGEVTLTPGAHADIAADDAILSVLRQAGRPFYAYDPRLAYPRLDPTGALLGSATPTLSAVASNNREATIAGLPVGYTLSRGDMLSYPYGSDPTRVALHQIVTGGQAGGDGTLAGVEVTPHIRPGYSIGAAVTLIRPYCRAVYLPGSYQPSSGYSRRAGSAISFSIIQTLRY